jgi:hypothetical protein
MRKSVILLSVIFIMAAGALPAIAQEKTAPAQEQPAPDPQMLAMMAAFENYGTPGPEHNLLLDGVGDWDLESKVWMDPAAPPTVVKGKAVHRAILDGRYVQYNMEGEMLGRPYTGYGITGYDRYNKKYVSLWLDNWGTGFYTTEGTADVAGKVRTETGSWDDYMTGKTMKVKNVYTHLSRDKFTMEMYMVQPDGKEMKTMELTYTRKK